MNTNQRPCCRCKQVIPKPGNSYCNDCYAARYAEARQARLEVEQEIIVELPKRYVFAPKTPPKPAERQWRIAASKRNAYGQPVPDFGAGVSVSFLSPEQVAEAKANGRRVLESAVQAR
jgi:hypothetical protein